MFAVHFGRSCTTNILFVAQHCSWKIGNRRLKIEELGIERTICSTVLAILLFLETRTINSVFFDFVIDDAFGDLQEGSRARLIAVGDF